MGMLRYHDLEALLQLWSVLRQKNQVQKFALLLIGSVDVRGQQRISSWLSAGTTLPLHNLRGTRPKDRYGDLNYAPILLTCWLPNKAWKPLDTAAV